MGSITEAGSVEGSIFLQTDITQEFKKTLKSTKHADANTFLEHLLGLFLSADADTRALKVRLDVAQKFAALQNLAKFPSSNELMKHLLQLHIKSDGQSSSSMPKSSQTKAQTAAQPSVQSATATGRRGRKSQPKRNYVHAALIDSDEESGIAGGPSGRDDVTGAVTDNDGSVSQTNGASIRSMGPVAMETTFDITKVKQEVDDDSEAMIKSKQNDKATLFKKIFQKKDYAAATSHGAGIKRNAKARKRKTSVSDEGSNQKRANSTRSRKKYYGASFGSEAASKQERSKKSGVGDQPITEPDASFSDDDADMAEETKRACVVIENVESDCIVENPELLQFVDSSQNEGEDESEGKKDNITSKKKYVYRYSCFHCGKVLRTPSQLTLHMVREHGEEASSNYCKYCGKQVDYDHELELHVRFLCRKIMKPFSCSVCKLSFQSNSELLKHPCTKAAKKPFFCMQADCCFSSNRFKDLTEHVTRHLGIKPYLCNVCGRAFSAKKDMDRHTDVHRDTKDHVCKYCGLSYRSLHSLNKHIWKHTHKDRFKCPECTYTTALRSSYNVHLTTHKKKTYKCNHCSWILRSEKSLAQHVQNRHSYNRLFSCNFCDFRSENANVYASHMRKHKHLKSKDATFTKEDSNGAPVNLPLSTMNTTTDNSEEEGQTISSGSSRFSSSTSKITTPFTGSPTMTLAAAALHDEEVDISGQNADALMANYVASASSSEIAVITSTDDASSVLVIGNMDIPLVSEHMTTCSTGILPMPSLMSEAVISDTMPIVSDNE